jgi:hypothetical protein
MVSANDRLNKCLSALGASGTMEPYPAPAGTVEQFYHHDHRQKVDYLMHMHVKKKQTESNKMPY